VTEEEIGEIAGRLTKALEQTLSKLKVRA